MSTGIKGYKKLHWLTASGGTSGGGKHSYTVNTGGGQYHIDPYTNQYGRFMGYKLWFINDKGAIPGGLWVDLGTHNSPNSAKSRAQKHYEGLGLA